MYICICNALRDRDLAAAVDCDVRNVADVFKRCGRRPQCGKCLSDVAQIIDDARVNAAATPVAAE